MAIGANSYGSVAEVEAMVPQFTDSGSFGVSTWPTTGQVEVFIDRVSAIVNVLLTEAGFTIPVAQATAKLSLDHFVVEEVADLCEAVNRSGRFFLGEEEIRARGRFRLILGDAEEFIKVHSVGFERLGVSRGRSVTYGLDYWDTDDAGDAIEPVFQREMMGNVIRDWDVG